MNLTERTLAFSAAPRPRPLVVFTRADLVEFKPTDWLVEGWLVKNTLAGMVGGSGVGKSFLALDWACRIASGTGWQGIPVQRGAVFYLAGEGQQGLRKRIAAWEKFNGVSMAGAPLYLADNLPFLTDEAQAAGTTAAIENIEDDSFFNAGGAEPTLVVIDTVARAMGGANENSAEDMGRLISAMDRLRAQWGACVLALHHTGHSADARARGSSAFRAALDSEFLLKAEDKKVVLSTSKGKDWKHASPIHLAKRVVPIEIPGPDGHSIADTSLALETDEEAAARVQKVAEAIRMAEDGMSHREIAAELKVGKSTVGRWVGSADAE